ncbi:glycosyltransferase family 9 protein [Dyadobacter sp. NIV53]|uniref:glycosyltransferase family 9 protein n=1 Tax=Dyadobacter sp. NIV53 TaxID=2861765 RepID=UPI001C87B88A|nr:glycosyltransferase family 9 protein [Dyadobacter sp. NIV53]
MSFKRTINNLRRGLMQKLTGNIGTSSVGKPVGQKEISEIKRVLISRPNHRLGNLLLITPLLQEISETLPNSTIDLFVKGTLSPLVFKNYDNINRIIQLPKKPFSSFSAYLNGWFFIKRNRYDIVINVIEGSSSGKLSAKFANAKYKFFGNVDKDMLLRYSDSGHMAKYPVYSFRNYLSELGFVENKNPVPPLSLKLSSSELAEGKKIVFNLVKNDKKTICLFTNATGDKIYTESWWGDFYERLKTEFPECNIIEILPVENTSQIGFLAPTYSHKDVRVVGSFIANTAVFIGADSGMMHLASAVPTPTVGLFKVTNTDLYEPYNNIHSVAIDTNTSNMDDWMSILKKFLGINEINNCFSYSGLFHKVCFWTGQ